MLDSKFSTEASDNLTGGEEKKKKNTRTTFVEE